jgi:hypothetical protein
MTAVVSGERAKATWLTGSAGLLILGGAVVMMGVAAPSQAQAQAQAQAQPRPRPHSITLAAAPAHTQTTVKLTARSDVRHRGGT